MISFITEQAITRIESKVCRLLRAKQTNPFGSRLLWGCVLLVLFTAAAAPVLIAQEPVEAPEAPLAPAGPPVTVRGVVLNAATGQPLPRVLVRVTSNEGMGALTNSEGRFEIRGVPSSVQNFNLTKPGFQERMVIPQSGGFDEGGEGFAPHAVRVVDGMPELSFSLSPKNAIFGHVTLSTGRPALGIGLVLFRQTIADGRASWEETDRHQTTPDGAFRYAGLSDGTYVLMSQPEFDNDRPAEPSCNAEAPAEMSGYPPVFFGDATDLAGATRITVAAGQNAEANLSLSLAKFHFVQAAVSHLPVTDKWMLLSTLFDHSGRQVEYPINKEKDNSLCAYLPDGSYTLVMQASIEEGDSTRADSVPGDRAPPKGLTGLLAFTVDGGAARDLRVSLTQSVSTLVNVHYEPAPPVKEKKKGSADREDDLKASPLVLSATRVNAVAQNEVQARAIPTGETSYALETALPGAYWIHVIADLPGMCLGPVTSGGQNLARSPWTAAPSGAGTPIDVVMRTDCASLTVQMPPALAVQSSGEGVNLYVYAVPEFDSIEGVSQGRLDQFSNRSVTLSDLPPGSYRVFAFVTPHSIEFQNPAAIEGFGPGQEVTLEPRGSVNMVLKDISK